MQTGSQVERFTFLPGNIPNKDPQVIIMILKILFIEGIPKTIGNAASSGKGWSPDGMMDADFFYSSQMGITSSIGPYSLKNMGSPGNSIVNPPLRTFHRPEGSGLIQLCAAAKTRVMVSTLGLDTLYFPTFPRPFPHLPISPSPLSCPSLQSIPVKCDQMADRFALPVGDHT